MSGTMGKIRRTILAGTAVTVFLSGALNASAAGLRDIFDGKYYADNNEDLKEAFGYDEELLYKHFLEHGLEEGRVMNPILDVVAYRAAYEDLEEAFGNDWDAYVEHFLTIGVYESNRREGVLFDPLAYAEAYGDIKEAFGDDVMAIIEHYETFGIQENRTQGTAYGYESIAARREAESIAAAKSAEAVAQIVSGAIGDSDVNSEYDENGKLEKKTWYNTDGSVSSVAVYEYDENGGMKETWYDADGSVSSVVVYEYDENGELEKKTWYNTDGSVSSVAVYEYDENGGMKETWYDAGGSRKAVYEYDENRKIVKTTSLYDKEDITWEYDVETDRTIKMAVYEKDGSLRDYKLYEYGEGGYTTKSYNAQSVLEYVTEYVGKEYDGSGKVVRQEAYVSGELDHYEVYEYDESGNRTTKTYRATGILQNVMVSEVRENGWYYATRLESYDESGQLSYYNTYEYDESGNKTERQYNAAGDLKYVREFDEDGNLISSTRY